MINYLIQVTSIQETSFDESSNNFTVTTNQHLNFDAISEIKSAIDQLKPDETTYTFYDLDLADEEVNFISEMNVKSNQFQSVKFNNSSLVTDVEKFCLTALSPENLCQDFSVTINKLISNILGATNSIAAELKFISHTNLPAPFPDWHLDKRHDEILSSQNENLNKAYQYVFIFSLIGLKLFFLKLIYASTRNF